MEMLENDSKKRRLTNHRNIGIKFIPSENQSLTNQLSDKLDIQDSKIDEIFKYIYSVNDKIDKLSELVGKIYLLDTRICRIIIEIDSIKKEIVDLQTHALYGNFHKSIDEHDMKIINDSTYQSHIYN